MSDTKRVTMSTTHSIYMQKTDEEIERSTMRMMKTIQMTLSWHSSCLSMYLAHNLHWIKIYKINSSSCRRCRRRWRQWQHDYNQPSDVSFSTIKVDSFIWCMLYMGLSFILNDHICISLYIVMEIIRCRSITTRIFHFFVVFVFAINFLMNWNNMQNKANHSFGDLRVFLPVHIYMKWTTRIKRWEREE